MKFFFIDYEKQNKEYIIPKILGIQIEKINKPEDIDKKIEELRGNEENTIIISNELASFSENLISKYKKDKQLNIIIIPSKNK